MRLDTLTIKGVLAFQQPMTFDFKDLPSGLIALVGPNGHGKTTFMESPVAIPFRKYPSYDDPLYENATGTDAFLEETFELEGRGLFYFRVNLDAPHRKADAVVGRIEPDGRRVLLNDGKLSTYDAVVAELLPRYEDLLASVIAVQRGVGSFSDLDRKGRRELMASLLGLDHLEQTAERARQAVTRVTQAIDRLSLHRDVLARSVGVEEETALEQRAQQLQVDGGMVESRRIELRRLIAEAETALSSLRDAAAQHAAARERADRSEAERLAAIASHKETEAAIAQTRRDLASDLARRKKDLAAWLDRNATEQLDESAYRAEVAAITKTRETTIAEAQKRITANEGLQQRAAAIRAAATQVTVIDASLAQTRLKLDILRLQLSTHQRRERVLADATTAIAQAQTRLDRAHKDAKMLEVAPFGQGCAPCGFMADAAAAKAQIAGLQEAVASLPTVEADLAAVHTMIAETSATITRHEAMVRELEQDRQVHATEAADLPHLTAAEEKIATRKQQITDAGARYTADVAAAQQRRLDRVQRLQCDAGERKAEHERETETLTVRAQTTIADLTTKAKGLTVAGLQAARQLAAATAIVLQTKDAAREATSWQARLDAARPEWEETTATLARLTSQREELDRRRRAFAASRAELDALETQIEQHRTDLVEWSTLAKAFGREGLQTIEIDHAGPAVSAFCNDLLHATFGGRFTVELITQAPKVTAGKDGSTHKEVLELSLYDNQRGGAPVDITKLSGGQRVVVEEALRSAIALLVHTRNQGVPMRTLFRDETTGALDPENALRYIAMLRRVQEIGGFEQVLFVTHNRDCAPLADAQIRIHDGKADIALPPYADTPELVEA